MMDEQLQSNIFENQWIQWLFVLGLALLLASLIKLSLSLIQGKISKFVLKTPRRWDNLILDCLAHTRSWILFIWVLNPLVHLTEATAGVTQVLTVITVIATALQCGIWGLRIIRGLQEEYIQKRVVKDASSVSALNLMGTAIKGFFLVALVMICLSNLGVDIAALVAGLGIGGIAVALAAQNILGDLFGSLSIVLDKPFVVGDFIVVGTESGTVEYIGVKTTRVRSLSGEELVFSNKDLLESRVKNFKRMKERRVVFKLQVPYSTSLEKIKQIPAWIKTFIGEAPLLRFERSHLSSYGASSYEYETVYWVTLPDFNTYMDLQQDLFHKIIRKFHQEKVQFALPVQVVTQNQEPDSNSNPPPPREKEAALA